MRCSCCNRALNDYESTLRHAETLEFLDTCMSCLEDTGIETIGREDLNPEDITADDAELSWDEEDE